MPENPHEAPRRKTRNIEGEEALVLYKGSVERGVSELLDGVRSDFLR